MKKLNLFGIFAIIALLTTTLAACSDDDDNKVNVDSDLVGTWYSEGYTDTNGQQIVFKADGTFAQYTTEPGSPLHSYRDFGTYSTTGSKLTMNFTRCEEYNYDTDKWETYSKGYVTKDKYEADPGKVLKIIDEDGYTYYFFPEK